MNRNKFRLTLDAGRMLVKSISTNKTKIISVKSGSIKSSLVNGKEK